jgi:hypothetical protein
MLSVRHWAHCSSELASSWPARLRMGGPFLVAVPMLAGEGMSYKLRTRCTVPTEQPTAAAISRSVLPDSRRTLLVKDCHSAVP